MLDLCKRGDRLNMNDEARGCGLSVLRLNSLLRTGNLFQVEEASQLFRAGGVAQFPQGFGLDLADALTGHVELLADFFQRVVGVHVDAKAHAQHLGFAWRQAGQHALHGAGQAGTGAESTGDEMLACPR